MKEQVENLLRTEKERITVSEKKKRDKHLISIGLIDEGKTTRIYQDEDGYEPNNAIFDEDKSKFYTEGFGALEVTDEEYDEICKYFPPKLTTKSQILGAEKTLSVIAEIVLWVGIM